MNLIKTLFEGLWIVSPKKINDNRGVFYRTYCENFFSEIKWNGKFVQQNISVNYKKGTFRGLHFQKFPFEEEKLVRCIVGSVLDIVVDLRKNSSSYLKHFEIELSSENCLALFIPKGFAHGFLTLEDNSVMLYNHSEFYNANHDSGINYKDPLLNINLKNKISEISEKDNNFDFINE
jgi:dTDP-4-dehydrorhamnose 3,5-epimerase